MVKMAIIKTNKMNGLDSTTKTQKEWSSMTTLLMAHVEKIKVGDDVFAIILRKEYNHPGSVFFTPNEYSQQLGMLVQPKDKITLESTWTHNGTTRNWIKYLQVDNFNQIFDFYELDKIKEIEEC